MSSPRFAAALAVTALGASLSAAQAQSPNTVTQVTTLAPGSALPTGNGNAAGINPASGGLNLNPQSITVGSANGLKFNLNPTFDTTTGNGALAYQGFQAAAGRWASLFSNNITINLNIGFSNLGNGGIIGQTGSTQANYAYSGVRSALASGATSLDDLNAVGHLASGNNFTQRINYTSNNPNGTGSPTPYTVNSGAETNTINTTNANAKALGIYAGNATANDATVTFNSVFAFDYNEADGVDGDKIDFLFVATHEIGHALGFISGVDILDGNSTSPNFFQDNQFTFKSTLDLFRYSADSYAQGNGVTDFTAGTSDKYFSLDGGTTKITSYSTGGRHGDGSQASHWKDNLGAGIMDPTAAYGEVGVIRSNDIRAFDAIGYTLAAAPEPSEFAAMGLGALGLGLLGLKARRRSAASA